MILSCAAYPKLPWQVWCCCQTLYSPDIDQHRQKSTCRGDRGDMVRHVKLNWVCLQQDRSHSMLFLAVSLRGSWNLSIFVSSDDILTLFSGWPLSSRLNGCEHLAPNQGSLTLWWTLTTAIFLWGLKRFLGVLKILQDFSVYGHAVEPVGGFYLKRGAGSN